MLKLGLRAKFFLYSNTLIVVTMTLLTVLAVVHERKARYEATERRGRSISEVAAVAVSDALGHGRQAPDAETPLVEEFLTEILSRNEDFMGRVAVEDLDGNVLATRGVADGVGMLEIRTRLEHEGEPLGTLVVYFSLERIERQVKSLAKQAAVVALLLLVGNSALTAAYVETLIRPILNLNQTMKWAGRGDLTVRARPRRGDEVGELAEAFNRMMDELEETRERDKHRLAHLAHTEKMAAVGTLAAGVAHEVNNPLGGILTCIENMRADPNDEEMRDRYVGMIHDGLKRIERTVANLLDFSRQGQMQLEPTSINHNLRHVAELVDYQTRKKSVRLVFELDPREPHVMADHFQMEQMFLNLVLNAIQAMPDGGDLVLHTRARNGLVVAEIRDSGVGIPDEIRDRIFDPFFTTREVGEGTGLGLAVTDSIVLAHGGTMEVESTVGKGSIFRVRLQTVNVEPSLEEI